MKLAQLILVLLVGVQAMTADAAPQKLQWPAPVAAAAI
jgi:hypothetical protein